MRDGGKCQEQQRTGSKCEKSGNNGMNLGQVS